MSIPEKFEKMDVNELFKLMKDPMHSGLTFGEYMDLAKAVNEITPKNKDTDKLNARVNSLEVENERLREENEKLRRALNIISATTGGADYDGDY